MTPEEVLSYPARVLTQAQREHYFEHGYIGVESLVPQDTLAELQRVTNEFVDKSRNETVAGKVFDIGPGHSAEHPVLRRLKRPDERHEAYWNFAKGLMADVAAKVDSVLSARIFGHLLKLGLPYFEARQVGQTVARLRELETVRGFFTGSALSAPLALLR